MSYNNASALAELGVERIQTADRGGSPQRSERITWIETARGLGIVLVVTKHILHGLAANGLLTESPVGRIWDNRYYNPQMAMFFALSGLFAERLASRGGRVFAGRQGGDAALPLYRLGRAAGGRSDGRGDRRRTSDADRVPLGIAGVSGDAVLVHLRSVLRLVADSRCGGRGSGRRAWWSSRWCFMGSGRGTNRTSRLRRCRC